MLNPRLIAGAAGLSLIVGAFGGWQVRGWRCDAAMAKIEREAVAAQEAMRAQQEAAATEYEGFRAGNETAQVRTETKIREVYRNVPVPADCAVHPDAVRLLDDAREAANGAASGEPDGTVQGD
jgi:hypothetical protein